MSQASSAIDFVSVMTISGIMSIQASSVSVYVDVRRAARRIKYGVGRAGEPRAMPMVLRVLRGAHPCGFGVAPRLRPPSPRPPRVGAHAARRRVGRDMYAILCD